MSCCKKLFGAAVDPADDPWSIELKQAWMMSSGDVEEGVAAWADPYDAITDNLRDTVDNLGIETAGKLDIPSWLWPRPKPSDFPLVNSENFGEFFQSGGVLEMIQQVEAFVEEKIFPAMPIMVGVDHSATAGVVSALARKYGPDMLSVIVLDQHFDAIPLSVRVGEISGAISRSLADRLASQKIDGGQKDHYCCGDFWAYLIDEGQVLARNLSFVGVGDYPGHKTESTGDNRFRKAYLGLEDKGCGFFPLEQFRGKFTDALADFIGQSIKTPYVYVSLDLDVGSYNLTRAARYMDRPGISAQNLLLVADQIRTKCRDADVELVGFDIMEFNMHFLGIETDEGVKDSSLPLVGQFITALTTR